MEVRRKKAEDATAELKARRRAMGNMQFVGFLYRKGLLIEKVVHFCLTDLLEAPSSEELECACKLLTTVGACLEVLPLL
jgi:translation initiation factor 4G